MLNEGLSASTDANPSLDNAVDSILAPEPATPVEATPQPEVTAPTPDTPASPTVETPSTTETETPKEAAPEADEDNLDDSDLDAKLEDQTQAVNPLDLKSSRGKRIYQSYKQFKAISDATGEDLTVERVSAMRDAFVDREAMEYEFAAADPTKTRNFVEFWNKTSPEGMTKMAETLPDTLAQVNPGAYIHMALPVLNRYTNALYQRAQIEANPEIKESLLYAARMLDWDLNSKYRQDAEINTPQPQVDPRAAEVDRRYNEIQRFQQSQTETTRNSWITNLDETNSRMLDAESDRVLAPLKAAYPSETTYKAVRRDFIEAVIAQVAKDQNSEQLYQIQRNRALAKMSSEDIPAIAKHYEQRASRVIRALAPSFLKESGVAAKVQSDSRNQSLATAAAAGKGPQGQGAPVPQSITPTGRFASKGEQMDAQIDALFGGKVR